MSAVNPGKRNTAISGWGPLRGGPFFMLCGFLGKNLRIGLVGFCMLLVEFPLYRAAAEGWLDGNKTTKTRVCTKAVLSFTDWITCEREPAAASIKEMCAMWGASCFDGCSALPEPRFCQLQCSARQTVCIARAR